MIKLSAPLVAVGLLWGLYLAGVTGFEYVVIVLLGILVLEVGRCD